MIVYAKRKISKSDRCMLILYTMKRILLIFALGVVIFFNACTKKETPSPEDAVKAFVTLSSSVKDPQDQKKLAEFCTGEMETAFTKMSADTFRTTYLEKKLALKDFKVVASNKGTESAEVRYLVNVENNTNNTSATESNVREVLLILKDGAWKIAAIRMFGSDQLVFNQGMNF